jgi:hypothetical protein
VVLDYGRHDDESMRDQADLWLGFEPAELAQFARSSGLDGVHTARVAGALCGRGPDAHLPWQVMVAKRPLAGAGGERADETTAALQARMSGGERDTTHSKHTNGRTSRRPA